MQASSFVDEDSVMVLSLDDLACGAALVFSTVVAGVDMRTHKIPNVLCLTAAIAGLLLHLGQGWHGLIIWLSGLVAGFAIFIPFYAIRAFGAGDVKAMAAVGGFLGAKLTLLSAGFTLVAGGVLGVGVLFVTSRSISAAWYRLAGVAAAPIAFAKNTMSPVASDSRQRFPYGLAIAIGVLTTLLIRDHL